MPNGADAFVAFDNGIANHAQAHYLLHTITQGITTGSSAARGQPKLHTYLIVAWMPAGMSRQLYAVEILSTRRPLNPQSTIGDCALQLLMMLGRAERGHCIQRETMLLLPSKTTVAVAAYLSLAWAPTLLLDVTSVEKPVRTRWPLIRRVSLIGFTLDGAYATKLATIHGINST